MKKSKPTKINYALVDKKPIDDRKRSDAEYMLLQRRAATRALFDLRHLSYMAIEASSLSDTKCCLTVLGDIRLMTDNAELQVLALQVMEKKDEEDEEKLEAANEAKETQMKPRTDINAAKNIVAAGLAETQNGRRERVIRVVPVGIGVPFVEASTSGAISPEPTPFRGRGMS